MNRNKGFTLIELLVVIIIIGILAAVAVPFVRGNVRRAIVTEAVTGMGTIRTALRGYYIKGETYAGVFNGFIGQDGYIEGIGPGDLTGTFFSEDCYEVYVLSAGLGYTIYCDVHPTSWDGQPNSAARAAETSRQFPDLYGWLYMRTDGTITSYNMPGSGYE